MNKLIHISSITSLLATLLISTERNEQEIPAIAVDQHEIAIVEEYLQPLSKEQFKILLNAQGKIKIKRKPKRMVAHVDFFEKQNNSSFRGRLIASTSNKIINQSKIFAHFSFAKSINYLIEENAFDSHDVTKTVSRVNLKRHRGSVLCLEKSTQPSE